MKHLFIPYELALQLKEKGFNEDCFGCYYKDKTFAYHPDSDVSVDAPLYQQVIDFIRDKGIVISIYNNASGYLWNRAKTEGGTDLGWSEYNGPNESGVWDSYYEALNNAIEEALKLI